MNYSRVFAMVKQINKAGVALTYQDLLWDFTENRKAGRTKSLRSLNYFELQEFERCLSAMTKKDKTAADYADDPLDKARKAIIANFKSINRTTDDAISWAERYGVNGIKKKFNDYNGQELFLLIRNSQNVVNDFIRSANKKL